jgi:uncharacterized protein YggE
MRDKLKITPILVSIVLAGFLLISAFSPDLTPQRQVGSESPQRTIHVSGRGLVSARPDIALVRLGVQTDAEEADAALEENNRQMQALVDTLKAAGIPEEDIQTQTFRLTPRYEETPTSEGQRELVGYTATNIVEARVRDITAVGSVLDAAVQAGGNRIEGIRFEISDPSAFIEQAREAAWNDAQQKAEQLTSLAGTELGDVMTINETGRGPQPIIEQAVMAEAAAAVPIEPGSQTIEVNLEVRWFLGSQE